MGWHILQVREGALYPALHRLEQQVWIRAKWRAADSGRKVRFYTLTEAGRKQLENELAQWERLSPAIGLVIHMTREAVK